MPNADKSIMKSYPDKKIIISLFFVTLISCYLGRQVEWQAQRISTHSQNEAMVLNAIQNPTFQNLTFGFAGTIALDNTIQSSVNKNFSGDYSGLFANTKFLNMPDITFANLELSTSNLNSNSQAIPALKKAGIDIVSITNNNASDADFQNTLKQLSESGILYCGTETAATFEQPTIIIQNGNKVGFICFSNASNPEFDSIIKSAKSQVDDLVVAFNSENQTNPNSSQQENISERAVDDGADMVIGGTPNNTQNIQVYKDVNILPNLGNLISDQSKLQGSFVTATLKNKTFTNVVPYTIVLDKNFAPSLE